jgi:hypothetical protein
MKYRSKLQQERVLMLTHGAEGSTYGLDTGQAVTAKQAHEIQSDLFVRPNDDGLFPDMPQTWKREA